jgi:endo-alpha-N-acetylgalactosaminidase
MNLVQRTVSFLAASLLALSANAAERMIASPLLAVTIDDDFPRVIGYKWLASGARLFGQEDAPAKVTINGTDYVPKVAYSQVSPSMGRYVLSVAELQVEVTVEISLDKNLLSFQVARIAENGPTKVKTLEFKENSLVSVRSTQRGAKLSACSGVEGDEFSDVAARKPGIYRKSHAIVNTRQLAAALTNNTIQNRQQVAIQTTAKPGYIGTGLGNNYWRYRYLDTEIVELPWAKVVVCGDMNGDGQVDWQDGAIALRNILKPRYGADKLRNSICYIVMNFESLAQNPFLRVLDNVKKFSNLIDGYGQLVELKGYQSEGHDSAHPDYGGNYNVRAGGLADLNFLIEKAAAYHAAIGFHINHTESYPEARSYTKELLAKPLRKGWAWLDQSYIIDRYADIVAGNLDARLEQLKREVPSLTFTYVDVYSGQEWEAWKLGTKLNHLNFAIWTEFAQNFDAFAIWTHQSWGPSKIGRFLYNQERDVWNNHPLLKGGTDRNRTGHSGWQNHKNMHETLEMFFTNVLPNRYMMHYPIKKWTDDRVDFFGADLNSRMENGVFALYRDGRPIARGETMFIPWDPERETKIYHWNPAGGVTTWKLPNSWAGQKTVVLYQLTDVGRKLAAELPVVDGSVTIEAKAKTPYVVYKTAAPNKAVVWGDGSPVKDMGFDSHGFAVWQKSSSAATTDHITIENDSDGNSFLKILGNGGADARVAQEISGLVPETSYAASVWVRVHGGRIARLRISGHGGQPVEAAITDTTVINRDENHKYRGTDFQRIKVYFTARKATAAVELLASAGHPDSLVSFDDVRIVAATPPQPGNHLLFEDFEHCDQGWGPFVYAQYGAGRTHLSELHEGYTDDTLNGRWSLKSFSEGMKGEVFRTIPATLRLAPKGKYSLSFVYAAEHDKQYSVVVRSKADGVTVLQQPLAASRRATCTARFATGPAEDYYIAFEKTPGEGTLVIDDFAVDGPAPAKTSTPAAPPANGCIPAYMMTITATSAQPGQEAANAVDGNEASIWHSRWSPQADLPQSLTFAFEKAYTVGRIAVLPRQEGANGIITAYKVYASRDGVAFTQIAAGTWSDDAREKSAIFAPTVAKYLKFEATAGRNGFASAAEVRIFGK